MDDTRYAAARAASLVGRGYGDEAIRAYLAGDGVPEPVIQEVLSALEPERERARRLVERLGDSTRTAAQLQRKGFGEEALEGLFADGEPEA